MNNEPIPDFEQFAPKASYFDEQPTGGISPDGLRDYRPHTANDVKAVGIGEVSREQSLDTAYLFRPAPGAAMERPRSCYPGEIGWGVPWLDDWLVSRSGQRITLGDFRQEAENRTTHQYLGAWYPGPEECTPLGSHGYYRENIFSGRPENKPCLPTFSTAPKDPTQGVCELGVTSRGRFRPLEAVRYLGLHRH